MVVGAIVVVGIVYAIFSNKSDTDGGVDGVTKTAQQVPEIIETAEKITNEDNEDVDEKAGVTVEVNQGTILKPTIQLEAKKVATFTMAEVAKHNSVASCYTAVNGSVYDVTTWIVRHPGGEKAILSTCGKDASAAFDTQHNTQARPVSELANYKIGVVAK